MRKEELYLKKFEILYSERQRYERYYTQILGIHYRKRVW